MKRLSLVLVAVLASVALIPIGAYSPAASVQLPTQSPDSMVVDQAHGKVFVSGTTVAVVNLSGALLGTIDGITNPGRMTLSADGTQLLVLDGHAIKVVAPASATVIDTVPLGDAVCPEQLAPASGKVFFGYYTCSSSTSHADQLGAVDLATGVVTTGLLALPWGQLAAIPGQPNALAGVASGSVVLIDTTGGLVPTATERTSVSSPDTFGGMAVAPDGSRLVVRSYGFGFKGFKALSTTDLSEVGSYPVTSVYSPVPYSVAIRADGMLAMTYEESGYDYVRIYNPGSSTPFVNRSYSYPYGPPQLIGFGTTFLYGVHQSGTGETWDLSVYTPGPRAKLTLTTSRTHYAWLSDVTLQVRLSSPTKSRKVSIFGTPEGGTERLLTSGYVDSAGRLNVTRHDLKINTTFRAAFASDGVYDSASASRTISIAGKVTLTSRSTSRSGWYHRLPASPTPYLLGKAYAGSRTGFVEVIGQRQVSGAWHRFDLIRIPVHHSRTFSVAIYGFKRGDKIRVTAQYRNYQGNISSPKVTYLVLLT